MLPSRRATAKPGVHCYASGSFDTAPRLESRTGEGKGLFIVRDDCPNATCTLPLLQRSPKSLDDVDPNSESHIYHAIRYALQTDRSPHIRFRRVVW